MTTNFTGLKLKIDLPTWRPLDAMITAGNISQGSVAGSVFISDLRASRYANRNFWFFVAATILYQHNTQTNDHLQLNSPGLTGVFGVGAGGVFTPSLGPNGTIAAGATTTTFTLTTVLPASVGANQLKGLRVRIIDNVTTGFTGEGTVLGNTAGTTPLITLETPLTFTPATGARYEFLSGRVYLLSSGLLAAGSWKYYDVATNSYSGNLSIVNLPATVSIDSSLVALDALHTPTTTGVSNGSNIASCNGEVGGFFGNITATGVSATSITGTVAGIDAALAANEFRNFQIRIIQDTTAPTAVGQRRRITSHTGGASPVYTVPAWTVNPSANAVFVIENNDDILLWSSAVTTTFCYKPSLDTWDTTSYAVRPTAMAAGCLSFQGFGGKYDTTKNNKYSNVWSFPGGNSLLYALDIAGGTTGLWSASIPYDNQSSLIVFGASAGISYDAVKDRAIITATQLAGIGVGTYLFEPSTITLFPYKRVPLAAGTVIGGNRTATSVFTDGLDKICYAYHVPSTVTTIFRSMMFV
jgi:hypothetical protein